jgi:acyl-CoA thioester hydrolase
MGVVYHAHYLVWCDVARTDHLRQAGVSYRELEEQGLRLAVTEAGVKYRAPARYDDQIRIRCWVRDLASRRVVFGYVIERAADGLRLATAHTTLISLDSRHGLSTIPHHVRSHLLVMPDPVRL